MVKSPTKTKKKTVNNKKKVASAPIEKQNIKIGITLGVILILLMLMANT
tara:strand:+ start:626 stop:772 length:147 start_codon:yes stop_codon:yes gene_type:complete